MVSYQIQLYRTFTPQVYPLCEAQPGEEERSVRRRRRAASATVFGDHGDHPHPTAGAVVQYRRHGASVWRRSDCRDCRDFAPEPFCNGGRAAYRFFSECPWLRSSVPRPNVDFERWWKCEPNNIRIHPHGQRKQWPSENWIPRISGSFRGHKYFGPKVLPTSILTSTMDSLAARWGGRNRWGVRGSCVAVTFVVLCYRCRCSYRWLCCCRFCRR